MLPNRTIQKPKTNTKGVDPELVKIGFVSAIDDDAKPQLILATEGHDKEGKTYFTCTAPDPIAFFSLDYGHKGVVEQFARKKKIFIRSLPVPRSNSNQAKAEADKQYKLFLDSYYRVLDTKSIRTLVIDTGGQLYNMLRLAKFGKLTQVMPHHYMECNAEWKNLLDAVYETDKNLIITHGLKKEYVNGKDNKEVWKGKFERDGFRDSRYRVQCNIRHFYDEDEREFSIQILNSRINQDNVRGMSLTGEQCNFKGLVAELTPDIPWEDWQ